MRQETKLIYTDLQKHFHNSIVPPSENKIGIEYEIICLDKKTLKRLDYDSKPGIKNILEYFVSLGFEPKYEEHLLIGASRDDFYMTLEPGGQLEASFAPYKTIKEIKKALDTYVGILKEIEDTYSIVFIACGVDPLNALADVPWMPKDRYRIMQKYLAPKGSMGHMMMKQSAAIQVNIDYNSEEDALRKHNMILNLSQPLMHMFANSSIYTGTIQNTLNFRETIWQNTDPERCGISLHHNAPLNSFQDYIDAALKIPMILLYKNSRFIEITHRLSFEEFIDKGYSGYTATIDDWKLHLNMLYPHLRFNFKTLEIRLFDCNKPDVVLAIGALIKGLVYNNKKIEKKMSAQEIVDFAKKELSTSEAFYLSPLEKFLETKKTCAEEANDRFIHLKNMHEFINSLKVL